MSDINIITCNTLNELFTTDSNTLSSFNCNTLEELINSLDDTLKYNIDEPNDIVRIFNNTIFLYDDNLNKFIRFLHKKNISSIEVTYNNSIIDVYHRVHFRAIYSDNEGKIKNKYFSTGFTFEFMKNSWGFTEERAISESKRIMRQIKNKLKLLRLRYII